MNNEKVKENRSKFDYYDYEGLPVKNRPVYLKCPNCQDFILTRVKRRPGFRSIISCCLISLVAWCGCCLIPCCLGRCTDALHECPNCRKVLMAWERKI
jgi:hypothetical protein